MNDRKTLLQREIEEENRARNQITVSPTKSQIVVTNANAASTGPSEPCTIGWRAILKARGQLSHCYSCGRSYSRRVKAADYSSFSDIDSDDVNCKEHNCSKRNGRL
ncbi:hypothetical protein Bca101_058883 [Brassica carinata]